MEAGLVAAFARRGAPYEEEVCLTSVGWKVAERTRTGFDDKS
jgi:hypothetical protein